MRILKTTENSRREIVLDIETTGLFTSEGHRIVEVAAVEIVDGRATGLEFHTLINPGRDIPAVVSAIHGITDETVKDSPLFSAIAPELRKFIGDSTVIITCRTKEDGYTLDEAFINAELADAGMPPVPVGQWLNVRRWSEAMYGEQNARLDTVLDHYGISRKERDDNGHGALLDARLLAEAYPKLLKDYTGFSAPKPASAAPGHKQKPQP